VSLQQLTTRGVAPLIPWYWLLLLRLPDVYS